MVPLYREALERWERRDDTVLQDTQVAQIRVEHRAEAASEAERGCTVAGPRSMPATRRRSAPRSTNTVMRAAAGILRTNLRRGICGRSDRRSCGWRTGRTSGR
jgi:hypothetical protein